MVSSVGRYKDPPVTSQLVWNIIWQITHVLWRMYYNRPYRFHAALFAERHIWRHCIEATVWFWHPKVNAIQNCIHFNDVACHCVINICMASWHENAGRMHGVMAGKLWSNFRPFLMSLLLFVWISCWRRNRVAGDIRCHEAYVTSMKWVSTKL